MLQRVLHLYGKQLYLKVLFDKYEDSIYCRVMCKVMFVIIRETVGCLSQQP